MCRKSNCSSTAGYVPFGCPALKLPLPSHIPRNHPFVLPGEPKNGIGRTMRAQGEYFGNRRGIEWYLDYMNSVIVFSPEISVAVGGEIIVINSAIMILTIYSNI